MLFLRQWWRSRPKENLPRKFCAGEDRRDLFGRRQHAFCRGSIGWRAFERGFLCHDLFWRKGRRQDSQKVDQTSDTNTYRKIVQKGLMLHLDLDPKPGQLRLEVQDERTGRVGTINTAYP